MQRGILITGGAHGIGKQICLDFLRQGDKVCFIDINEEASKRFESEYHDLYYYYGDVANPDTLKNYVDFAKKRLGRIDVGLKAPYELSRLCKEELIKNKGKIINIASSRAFQSEPDSEAYASAKGGIVALTHALAISLGPDVLVNCIAPGWINVDEIENFGELDKASLPAGKVGTPKDISKMVLFLCGQDFITGETITIDGGMNKRMIYHGDWNWQYHEE